MIFQNSNEDTSSILKLQCSETYLDVISGVRIWKFQAIMWSEVLNYWVFAACRLIIWFSEVIEAWCSDSRLEVFEVVILTQWKAAGYQIDVAQPVAINTETGPLFTKKTPSYQYRNSHYKPASL